MTNKKLTDIESKRKFKLDDLLRVQREQAEKPKPPVDVEVLLGDSVVTVRIPHLPPAEFDKLADRHSPHLAYRDQLGCWFLLEPLTRDHPEIVLLSGGEEDDLFVLRGGSRNKEAFYRWSEVYDALGHEDRQSVQAAIWGLYVHEPSKRLVAAKARAVKEDSGE